MGSSMFPQRPFLYLRCGAIASDIDTLACDGTTSGYTTRYVFHLTGISSSAKSFVNIKLGYTTSSDSMVIY